MKTHLLEAKKSLYLLLIKESITNLSDVEIDLMYTLSKDTDIQLILEKNK